MKVLGVTGMPGSGKSIFLDTAIEKSAIVVSMGDIIREKAAERGEDTGTTARKIREEFGQYIVSELTVERIKEILKEDNGANFILVDGIRSPYEIEDLKGLSLEAELTILKIMMTSWSETRENWDSVLVK